MKRDYQDEEYAKFRKAVAKRDKGKCQMPDCNKKGRHVHHIIRWVDSIILRYEPTNGIMLCIMHHKEVTGNEYIYASLFQEIVKEKSVKRKRK